ncbi:MAG: hypothetical protein IPJ77_18145 [Planctomycetes bacterium]|nr:hypothetical protein [Planctomycetota bacterium]
MSEAAGLEGARPDPHDRIADHALREVHGLHRHPDLTARIVAAWQRGERGTDVTAVLEAARRRLADEAARRDVELEAEDDAPRRQVRPRVLAAAAGLVLALGAAAAWWWSHATRVAPIASSTDALRVFRPGEGAELDTRELLAGDVVLTGAGEVAWLDLASGGRLVLGPCGALTTAEQDAGAWALARGRVEARDVPRALVLDAGFARLVASPGSALLAEIGVDDAELACSEVHGPAALRELLARLPQAPRTLHIAVERGGVELEHDGRHETLSSGDVRDVDGPANPARLVTDEGKAELLAHLDALRRGPRLEAAWWTTFAQRERELVTTLAKHLEKSPQYWPLARAEIVRRVRDGEASSEFARRAVDVALLAPEREGVPLVRALWLADPGAFREPQIVTLAERGLFEFEREALAMVELHEPGAGPAPLWAAVWLANQGDARARGLLARALEAPEKKAMTPYDFDALALAAFTLDRAGDGRAWLRGQDLLQPEIERALANGMGPSAVAMALELRFLNEGRRKGELVTPTRLLYELGPYIEAHRAEIADDEALSRLLDELRR